MPTLDEILDRCLALGPEVRYAAVYRGGMLRSRERAGLAHASTSESDRYEELLVNPTLLTLVRQRGNIDCGGLRFVLIRYGNFFEFVAPVAGGHVSVGVETTADLVRVTDALEREVVRWSENSGVP
jgi:hypothetical protein